MVLTPAIKYQPEEDALSILDFNVILNLEKDVIYLRLNIQYLY